MTGKNKNRKNPKNEIQEIGITKDCLTNRGGLAFLLKYLKNINILPQISEVFKDVRKSRKGKEIKEIISQLMLFFIDGSKFTMTRFDELAKDVGHQKVIESDQNNMCSSHDKTLFFCCKHEDVSGTAKSSAETFSLEALHRKA